MKKEKRPSTRVFISDITKANQTLEEMNNHFTLIFTKNLSIAVSLSSLIIAVIANYLLPVAVTITLTTGINLLLAHLADSIRMPWKFISPESPSMQEKKLEPELIMAANHKIVNFKRCDVEKISEAIETVFKHYDALTENAINDRKLTNAISTINKIKIDKTRIYRLSHHIISAILFVYLLYLHLGNKTDYKNQPILAYCIFLTILCIPALEYKTHQDIHRIVFRNNMAETLKARNHLISILRSKHNLFQTSFISETHDEIQLQLSKTITTTTIDAIKNCFKQSCFYIDTLENRLVLYILKIPNNTELQTLEKALSQTEMQQAFLMFCSNIAHEINHKNPSLQQTPIEPPSFMLKLQNEQDALSAASIIRPYTNTGDIEVTYKSQTITITMYGNDIPTRRARAILFKELRSTFQKQPELMSHTEEEPVALIDPVIETNKFAAKPKISPWSFLPVFWQRSYFQASTEKATDHSKTFEYNNEIIALHEESDHIQIGTRNNQTIYFYLPNNINQMPKEQYNGFLRAFGHGNLVYDKHAQKYKLKIHGDPRVYATASKTNDGDDIFIFTSYVAKHNVQKQFTPQRSLRKA